MHELAGTVALVLSTVSIIEKGELDLVIKGLSTSQYSQLSINFGIIAKDDTKFILGVGAPFEKVGEEIIFKCPQTSQLSAGLYTVLNIFLSSGEPEKVDGLCLSRVNYGEVLFEVRTPDVPARTMEQLSEEYHKVLVQRDEEFLSGFGLRSDVENVIQYQVFLFIKDCMITRHMRLGRYEIYPFSGLACNDELALMQDFLERVGASPLTNVGPVLDRALQGQPTVVVHFPIVFATSVPEAGSMVESEVQILCDVLSIFRGSYATIFGSVIIEKHSGALYFKLITPHYSGNLLGGAISGEDPATIIARVNRARNDTQSQLYVALYSEALREQRIEIAYFRYWNLLETIARSRNYIGLPLLNWNNAPIMNRRGQARTIQDDAEELVLELIRRTFLGAQLSEGSFSSELQQGLIQQQVAIWYRHRNCMVHTGGCFSDDAVHCDQSIAKYVNCKQAHDEIIQGRGIRGIFEDQYLRNLRETASLIIANQLAGRVF